jgi:signal peptidase
VAVQVQRGRVGVRDVKIRRRGVLLPAAVVGVVVLAPLAVLLSTVLLLGWQLQVIETASMQPRLAAGSLAVVEPVDAADVRAGMVIVFEDPSGHGRLVAHRAVTRLRGDPPVWRTQGDANADPDVYPVHASAIRGRVRWAIPHLGAVASAVHTRATAMLLIGLPLALLAATELVAIKRRKRGTHGTSGALAVYAVHDVSSTPSALIEVFAQREDAEAFVNNLRHDRASDPESLLLIEQQLDAAPVTTGEHTT